MQRLPKFVFVNSAIFLGAVLAIYWAGAAKAQDEKRRGADVQIETPRVGVKVQTETAKPGEKAAIATSAAIVRASDLIGLNVYGPNNESLGEVNDLVLDPSKGAIRYGVLSFGGFLGMGDKLFAVPWEDLKISSEGLTSTGTQKPHHFSLSINKDALKNAPGFDKNQWPNFADPNWSMNIDKFYNEQRRAARDRDRMR